MTGTRRRRPDLVREPAIARRRLLEQYEDPVLWLLSEHRPQRLIGFIRVARVGEYDGMTDDDLEKVLHMNKGVVAKHRSSECKH